MSIIWERANLQRPAGALNIFLIICSSATGGSAKAKPVITFLWYHFLLQPEEFDIALRSFPGFNYTQKAVCRVGTEEAAVTTLISSI